MGLFRRGAKNWRGVWNESDMTGDDWERRGEEQTSAMFAGKDWKDSNPDEDGSNTAGCYDGDYTDEYHDQQNKKLEEDEYHEAQVENDVRSLWDRWLGR